MIAVSVEITSILYKASNAQNGSKVQFNSAFRDKDNFPKTDKGPAPNVSVIWRFHFIEDNTVHVYFSSALFTDTIFINFVVILLKRVCLSSISTLDVHI